MSKINNISGNNPHHKKGYSIFIKTNAEYLKAYRARQKERGLIRCDVWVPVDVAEAVCNWGGSGHSGHHIGRLLTKHFTEIFDAIKGNSTTRVAKRKKEDNRLAKKRVHTDTSKEFNCADSNSR